MQTLFMDLGVVDRHLFDGDLDLTFHVDADRDPDHTPNFTHLRKSNLFWTSNHSSASLHCLIFLISVIICNIYSSILKFSSKSIMSRIPFTFGWNNGQNNADPTGSGSTPLDGSASFTVCSDLRGPRQNGAQIPTTAGTVIPVSYQYPI